MYGRTGSVAYAAGYAACCPAYATPGENSANSGPAWLVLGPEFSNEFNKSNKQIVSSKQKLLYFTMISFVNYFFYLLALIF